MLMAVLLLCGVVPMTVAADFVKDEKEAAFGKDIILQNDFIQVTVNTKSGRFGIRTVDGQPTRKNDQNTNLSFWGGLFGKDEDGNLIGDSGTSFTTFRVNGTDYIFGNEYSIEKNGQTIVTSEMGETMVVTHDTYESIPEGCQAVLTEWKLTLPGMILPITFTQVLLLYPNLDSTKRDSGNVQIYYLIANPNRDKNVEIGARILLDTMVGANDGPEFQIGTISGNTLKVERMLSRDPVADQNIDKENENYWSLPDYWMMKDTLDPSNPLATNVVAYGYTQFADSGYRDVDYMVVSHWNKLANEKFEEFDNYKAIPAEQQEAAKAYSEAQRAVELATALAEQKQAEARLKEEAALGQAEGTKAQLDAQKARSESDTVNAALEKLTAQAEAAKSTLAAIGRVPVGNTGIIDPNLDFTTDKNDYGTADSAVAFYWNPATVKAGEFSSLGTIYGLGEIVDPTSVLAITFPSPITQVEINPNNQREYKNDGVFDINVEVENLHAYDMKHDSIDITMELEKGLRFVKRDEAGNIVRDENGKPVPSYSSTQTKTYQKPLTPEQAEAGESNPILPGEKIGVTFTVMAQGKPWPTTRQYMVTATSAALATTFESQYGLTASDDIKAMYNASRANFIFLPSVGEGTPSYSTSVSPEECFTTDPKYITVNLTNIEAYNPGSSVRGQEAAPNFNLYLEEVVTGARYQVDVTDNVQCIPTDDGVTGDMRISYTNGTLVDANGVVQQLNMGAALPVGEYRVAIDYISTDDEENAVLDLVTPQTFLVTENEVARIREPAILAVVRETVDFDDGGLMETINNLVTEVEHAIEELQQIGEKLAGTDWSAAVYDELTDFVKELASPVLKIYDDFEKLADFSNIESEMRELAKTYDELEGLDFSSLKNFDLSKAINGVNVDISFSEALKKKFDIEALLLGPLGFESLDDVTSLVGGDGSADSFYDALMEYVRNIVNPIEGIYEQVVDLTSSTKPLTDDQWRELVDGLKDTGSITTQLQARVSDLYNIQSLRLGPFGSTGESDQSVTDTIYAWLEDYFSKLLSPITSIYNDLGDLADFSNLSSELDSLKAAYSDLGLTDAEWDALAGSIENISLKDILKIDVSLSKTFQEKYAIDKLLLGPFGSLVGSEDNGQSITDTVYGWLEDYINRLISPITSAYNDINDLADFSDISAQIEELKAAFPDLEITDEEIKALQDISITDLFDIDVSLSEKFKQQYDIEKLLMGPFGGSDTGLSDLLYNWLEGYVKRLFSPLFSIYDDITDLTDFSDIEAEAAELVALYPELAGLDWSALAKFPDALSDTLDSLDVNVSLTDKFKEVFDYEKILKGPFYEETEDGKEKDAGDVFLERVTAYGLKLFDPLISIFDDIEELADFTKLSTDISRLSKDIDGLGELDFSALDDMDFDIGAMLKKAFDATSVDLSAEFKKQYLDPITAGPVDSKGEVTAEAVEAWVMALLNGYNKGVEIYNLAKNAYNEGKSAFQQVKNEDFNGLKAGVKTLVDLYQGVLGGTLKWSFDAEWNDIVGKQNIDAAKRTYDEGEKMVLAFIAMYAKVQDIYTGVVEKYNRAQEIYKQVIEIKDKAAALVTAIGKGDFSALIDVAKDAVPFILGEWLNPVMDAIHSGQQLYNLGKRAYNRELGVEEGAKLLLSFYENYLNVDIDVDYNGLDAMKKGATQAVDNAQVLYAGFMVMYAKMSNIYSSLETKINRAGDVYDEVIALKDQVVTIVKQIGSGDLSALTGLLKDMGGDLLNMLWDAYSKPINDAVNSVLELKQLVEDAYNGKLSVRESATRLKDFLETYLDIDVKLNTSYLSANQETLDTVKKQAKQQTMAFMVMASRVEDIASGLKDKYDRAKEVYENVSNLAQTVVDVVGTLAKGDFKQLGNDLLGKLKDLLPTLLDGYLSPMEDAYNSVRELYELGERAYQGKASVKEIVRGVSDFLGTYLDVQVSLDFSTLKKSGTLSTAQELAKKQTAALMVMASRVKTIYESVSKKVTRAGEVYSDIKSLVNTVIDLVKQIAGGKFSTNDLLQLVTTYGMNLVTSLLNAYLSPIRDAISSVKELYAIGQHAYKGDISEAEGGKLLMDFYATYLNVQLKPGASAAQSKQLREAFTTMYRGMKPIYASLSQKIDTAVNTYDSVNSAIKQIIKLASGLSDPMGLVNDLLDMGKESIFGILNAYMAEIKDMYNSVKDIYEIGKRAYEGKLDIKEGAELLVDFCVNYLDVDISVDLDAVGQENKEAASKTAANARQMALAFMAMYARMKNIYSSMSSKFSQLTNIYDEMMGVVNSITELFTDPAKGAYALMDMVKARIMQKLDGMGMYKDMFMEVLDVIENFDQYDPEEMAKQALSFVVNGARVKADQALYSELYGLMVTAATALDPKSDYEWDPGTLKKALPTYTLKAFDSESEYQDYVTKMTEQNEKKKTEAKKDQTKEEGKTKTNGEIRAAEVGNDGVLVKITGMIRQIGEGENITDYIVDTSAEPAIINDTVAFSGSDIVFTQGKLKISIGGFDIDAGKYISQAQSIYGSETPLFDTLFVSGTGQLYIEGSGFVFHEGEWSLDFYNGFEKILDPEKKTEEQIKKELEEKKNQAAESDALNETAAWAVGALNDMLNPFAALTITDVYFNRHTLFSAPSFSVAGFGLEFDNYLLRSSEVCFGGHIDFKIVKGEIQNVFFNSEGLQSIEADLKFDLGGDLGLLAKDESAGGNLIIHYYDPDYRASFAARGYPTPEEKYGLDFKAKLKSVGSVAVELSFKRVQDGRILPDVIAFEATPPAPGILVTGGTYLTALRGAIRELADTIAGGSGSVPLIIEAGVDIKFGVEPAVFNGKIDMILKMTGIEFNGKLDYKGKKMITMAQIKAQWVTPWFVSASMEMDVLGLNVIIGKARLFIGQNLEKDRIDFEGFVSAALQIPSSVPVVGGFQLGQVSFGLNNDKIWGSASVGVAPIAVAVGITYYWNGGIEFGTSGEGLPEAYSYLLLQEPEEEPVLIAIGTGMRTEATSWVNEDTIHAIEYHAISDGVTMLDNGQNDIGIGGIEVSDGGKTHVIPVGTVASDRDALIEIEYYGDEKSAEALEQMLEIEGYAIQIADGHSFKTGDNAFKQELETTDGVTRHLVYVMVKRSAIPGTDSKFTLTSGEKVATKLLSTPIPSSLGNVSVTGSGTSYTALVSLDAFHSGDTLSLYLTKEPVGTGTETYKDEQGNTVTLTEDNDPGILIFNGIPVSGTTVSLTFDVSDIGGYGTGDTKTQAYAVDGLRDIRELLESGDYYLRAALKSDTAYDAKTSSNTFHLEDPKAPAASGNVTLVDVGNGYFNLSFNQAASTAAKPVTQYRIDFCDEKGNLYPNYSGLLFDAEAITTAEYLKNGVYTLRLGGWTVTGGEGTALEPYTYSGLETGKKYIARVYAANQTGDGNYHYATAAASTATELHKPELASVTSIRGADGKELGHKYLIGDDGKYYQTSAFELVTNQAQPTLTLTTDTGAAVEAWNGDQQVGVLQSDGTLALTGLTSDGEYAVELRMTNTATQDMSVQILYVTIDTIEPTILITSPRSVAATTSETEYDSSGNAIRVTETTEAQKGVDFRQSFQITGKTTPGATLSAVTESGTKTEIPVQKDGSFAGNVKLDSSLPTGQITLMSEDAAGNVSTAVVTAINSSYQAPIGLNVVRTGIMRPGATQTLQVYLRYADGKDANGNQKYRSEKVPAADMNKLGFAVDAGNAVTVSNTGTVTASAEGASLLTVRYYLDGNRSGPCLDTGVAILVSTTADSSGSAVNVNDVKEQSGGGTSGGDISGGGAGGGAGGGSGGGNAGATADVVVNGKSRTIPIGSDSSAVVNVTAEDGIDTDRALDVKNLANSAANNTLNVSADVAEKLSGENGKGVSFTGGDVQLILPGKVLTGEELTISCSTPSASASSTAGAIAAQLSAQQVLPGKTITLSGADVEPGNAVKTSLEIPAGTNVADITAIVFIDEDGNYTNLPWKLDVAGSTAYAEFNLPGSGTVVPMSAQPNFIDVPSGYWGAADINAAARQLLVLGYPDKTFRPENPVTRAEFTTLMLRGGGLMTEDGVEISYTDVSPADWCYRTISIATGLDTLRGVGGYALPNRDITRAEGMAIASRMMRLLGIYEALTDDQAEQILSGFPDQASVPAWARNDAAICVKYGIIVGTNTGIAPNDAMSRTQAAVIANRISAAIARTL